MSVTSDGFFFADKDGDDLRRMAMRRMAVRQIVSIDEAVAIRMTGKLPPRLKHQLVHKLIDKLAHTLPDSCFSVEKRPSYLSMEDEFIVTFEVGICPPNKL